MAHILILFDDAIDGCHVRVECYSAYGYSSVVARVWNGPSGKIEESDGYRYPIFFQPVAVKVFGQDKHQEAETWALDIVGRMGWELMVRTGYTDYIG